MLQDAEMSTVIEASDRAMESFFYLVIEQKHKSEACERPIVNDNNKREDNNKGGGVT